jgi:KDO2-lipid IV(A) lauroyltransferase
LVSILPFPLLYLLSDAIYFLLFYVFGYRKKVVLENLTIAFPEKSEQELKRIRKKFYHHFVDIFMEMIKTFTISNEKILKRFKLVNKEELAAFMAKHQNVLLMSSHYANYEWLFSLNLLVTHNGFAAYKKVKNPYFNKFIVKSRGRFNSTLVSTKEFMKTVAENDASGDKFVYGILSDQSPRLDKSYHWSPFFGQQVPVFVGTESLSKKYNYPVMYIDTMKVKRGYYEAKMIILTENPKEIPNFDLTDLFMKKLEEKIRRKPEFYFWTHKRFKHANKNINQK